MAQHSALCFGAENLLCKFRGQYLSVSGRERTTCRVGQRLVLASRSDGRSAGLQCVLVVCFSFLAFMRTLYVPGDLRDLDES